MGTANLAPTSGQQISLTAADIPTVAALQSQTDAVALLLSLQRELTIEALLTHTLRFLQTQVGVQGIGYNFKQTDLNLHIGALLEHRLSFELLLDHHYLGVVTFYTHGRQTPATLQAIKLAMALLSHPLQNAISYHLALKLTLEDPLTGLGNRRAMLQALHRELELSKRQCKPLCLLMLDVDHFKAINDQHGHTFGDHIIRLIGQFIGAKARTYDLVFRYAGDEFVIILTHTHLIGAMNVATRLHTALSAHLRQQQLPNRTRLQLSISVGIAPVLPADSPMQAFQRVDNALYSAKRDGRDCVRLHQH